MAETPDIYQALLDGNPDGVWPIWLVWQGPLIVWGLRFLKDQALVEDAVADTLLTARDHAGTFNDKGHILAWLHSTVRNKCWTALRKQRQLVSLEDEAEYSSDLAASQSIDIKDSEIMSRKIIQLIVKRLNKMPRKRRVDCYAFLFEGKTIAQIAKERGVSRSTADRNLRLGLAVIQKYLIDTGLNF